jgi:hypothetical protein
MEQPPNALIQMFQLRNNSWKAYSVVNFNISWQDHGSHSMLWNESAGH